MKTKKMIKKHNVVWNTPSKNSSGSMPIGNGDTGLNVWVEEDGDLLFYIAKSDAFDNNRRPIKLGRIRVRLSPNPFAKGAPFLQTLNLYEGEINITAGDINIVIWVDAHHSIVHLETNSKTEVKLELWRDMERPLVGAEAHCLPENSIAYVDTVVERDDGIMWFYRNKNTNEPSMINRTSGAFLTTDGRNIRVYTHIAQTETAEAWVGQLEEAVVEIDSKSTETAHADHKKWWAEFWDRSWISIAGSEDAFAVSQGYTLQRFMNACAGRGKAPIQFNGSLFTVDVYDIDCIDEPMTHFLNCAGVKGFNADYRRWGGLIWWQNIRLTYWPMIVAGDYEMLLPLFDIYTKTLMDAKKALNEGMGYNDAAVFMELACMGGAFYRGVINDKDEGQEVSHIYYQIIELALMMLDYCEYTNDREYLMNEVIPMADAGIRFYDQHFKRNSDGKLCISPVNACETYWKTTNPTNEVAGLRYLIKRLEKYASNEQKAVWESFFNELPELPIIEKNRRRVLDVAEIHDGIIHNYENPELYAVFPFRIYGVGKPDLEIAQATFENREFKVTGNWHQDAIDAAYIGDAEYARKCVADNFSRKNPSSRFPAFWKAGLNWVPDLDNGGVGMIALQGMLMQAEGDKILLLPAWPADWDVDFKLNAPKKTVVEGSYKDGKLISLKINPKEREKDIMFGPISPC